MKETGEELWMNINKTDSTIAKGWENIETLTQVNKQGDVDSSQETSLESPKIVSEIVKSELKES